MQNLEKLLLNYFQKEKTIDFFFTLRLAYHSPFLFHTHSLYGRQDSQHIEVCVGKQDLGGQQRAVGRMLSSHRFNNPASVTAIP